MEKNLSVEISDCLFGKNSEIFLRLHRFDPEAYGNFEEFECQVLSLKGDTSEVVFHDPSWFQDSDLTADGALLLCSSNGRVLRVSKEKTETLFADDGLQFMAISTCDDNVVAACQDGQIVIIGPNETRRVALDRPDQISCIRQTKSGGFYVLTINQGLFEWTGSEFVFYELATNVDLYDLFVFDDGSLCICGERGVVLVGVPPSLEVVRGTDEDLNNICIFEGKTLFSAPEAGIFELVDDRLDLLDDTISPDAIYSDGTTLYCASDNEILCLSGENWRLVHKVHDPTGYHE